MAQFWPASCELVQSRVVLGGVAASHGDAANFAGSEFDPFPANSVRTGDGSAAKGAVDMGSGAGGKAAESGKGEQVMVRRMIRKSQ